MPQKKYEISRNLLRSAEVARGLLNDSFFSEEKKKKKRRGNIRKEHGSRTSVIMRKAFVCSLANVCEENGKLSHRGSFVFI